MKFSKFNKFSLLAGLIVVLFFGLSCVCSAHIISVAPSHINLGSVKPGDEIEKREELVVKFSKETDVEKISVVPVEGRDFNLKLEGMESAKILASYSCKKISCNKKARIVHIQVTIKVNVREIKAGCFAGKYRGEIIITFAEMP